MCTCISNVSDKRKVLEFLVDLECRVIQLDTQEFKAANLKKLTPSSHNNFKRKTVISVSPEKGHVDIII